MRLSNAAQAMLNNWRRTGAGAVRACVATALPQRCALCASATGTASLCDACSAAAATALRRAGAARIEVWVVARTLPG